MTDIISTLSSRHEFLFLYDIKMGNPNGDPDENRPRVLPDGSFYVTDVRLKRFIRDYLKTQTFLQNGQKVPYEILVDTVEGKTTNLTNRVAEYLKKTGKKQCQGKELVNILLDAFMMPVFSEVPLLLKAKKKKTMAAIQKPQRTLLKQMPKVKQERKNLLSQKYGNPNPIQKH